MMRQSMMGAAIAALALAPMVGLSSASAQEELDLKEIPDTYEEGMFGDAPWDPNYEPPRTKDGRPSFRGTWTNASLTRLTRPQGLSALVISGEEAFTFITATQEASAQQDSSVDEGAPEAGDSSQFRTDGYDSFWTDRGNGLTVIDGEIRTSLLTSPANGQLSFTAAGQRRRAQFAGWYFKDDTDNPEDRGVSERCLAGFGGTGVAPMTGVLYNNTYVFDQDRDVFVVVAEMIHQPRLFRIGGTPKDMAIDPWLGDSVGEWDGHTFVATTTNFHPQVGSAGSFVYEEDTVVEERFTRVADDVIHYEFKVIDPDIYTEPHIGEGTFTRTDDRQYEYACHEGNYSLPGMLAGTRRKEKEAAAAYGQ